MDDVGSLDPSELQGLLGYFNFSTGRPDPRAQSQMFALWTSVADAPSPRMAMFDRLDRGLATLQNTGNSAFQDVVQAQAVIDLGFRHVPGEYRHYHLDLLYHLNDLELFNSGFLARCVEAVLSQQGPWNEHDRIVAGAIKRLNDYVGHRPLAVLEGRQRGEPYDHERVCASPLILRGVGVAPGKYAGLVQAALDLLSSAPEELLTDACFSFDHLDELSVDPRAYDHNHPADKGPNYRFGEWDPHLIDNRGFYRRLVVRQAILDGLLARVETAAETQRAEFLMEAATVLAGTMLMASGISGAGPETHDSSVSLSTLMPRIARYRDAFYEKQLASLAGSHGERLRQESAHLRQPFGGARQHINQYLAQQRAAQLQQRRLAVLLAELGYADAARQHAITVPATSMRLLTEIHIHLSQCRILAESGKHAQAADRLAEAEAVLHRAIACGAVVDPWNIIGFQGLYPLFNAREDSVVDHRILELIFVVDRMLGLYARLRGDASALGDADLGRRLAANMDKFASWWDQFATTSVNDIPHLSGKQVSASADHVAKTLSQWHKRGEAAADLAFWKKHLRNFRTPKAFALVVEELLRKKDYRAAMALLMTWLSLAERIPLEDRESSFHALSMRWMLEVISADDADAASLVPKYLDYLEANAEEYWHVPRLEPLGVAEQLPMPREHDEEDALFGAAYEGVTFKDSADDGTEGEVIGFEPKQDFELDHEVERLEGRLRFLATVPRLFHIAARFLARKTTSDDVPLPTQAREFLEAWLSRASRNYQDLLSLMDAIHERPIPSPSGSYESMVEFDRRNMVKQRLLTAVIATCLESALAVGGLLSLIDADAERPKRPRWEPALLQIEHALWKGDAATIQKLLPRFLEGFQHEPLLYIPLAQVGHPRLILRSAIAQTLLRALAVNLPRLGLLRETHSLVRVARTMEREQKLDGPRITEFDRLFMMACQASVEAAVESIRGAADLTDTERMTLLGRLIDPYLRLWADHGRTVRMSILEAVGTEQDWAGLTAFIKKHGRELFHARFMTLGNLRGILQGGVGAYLRRLEEDPDPENRLSLIDDLDKGTPRAKAEHYLQIIFQAVIDNYEEYKDYNTTTPQSDYGDNLHVLLDFLRLKAGYERQATIVRPLSIVHEVLARSSSDTAALWQQQAEKLTATPARAFLEHLAGLEKKHGVRLRTVADRVGERFVQPFALDRVVALIEPAFDEARLGESQAVLEQLEKGWKPYLDAPTGAGLDVPAWLRRLEGELQRTRMKRTEIAHLAESLFQVPRHILPVENLRGQLDNWPGDRGQG